MERPVLIAGDDGVPVRVREELAGLGIPTVSICSHKRVRAARAAAEAGARVVIGEVTQPGRANIYRRPDGSLTHW